MIVYSHFSATNFLGKLKNKMVNETFHYCERYHEHPASGDHNQRKVKELSLVLGKGCRYFSTVLLSPKTFLLVFQNKILIHEVENNHLSNHLYSNFNFSIESQLAKLMTSRWRFYPIKYRESPVRVRSCFSLVP